jgi:hypothetical protein
MIFRKTKAIRSSFIHEGEGDTMGAASLPRVKMPNRDNFFSEFPKLMPQRPRGVDD